MILKNAGQISGADILGHRDDRKWFSVRTGAVMQSSKLDLQVWVIAVYLLNTGLKERASMKLHATLESRRKRDRR